MNHFRTNLTPVEVTVFLKIVAPLTDNLLIRYCQKGRRPCPQCGHPELCHSGAISLYSSSFDKVTHEIVACLKCRYTNLSTLLTCEKM